MKKYYLLTVLFLVLISIIYSCSKKEDYVIVQSPIVLNIDLTKVPYPKLSDYKFFSGDLKSFTSVDGVLPYEPASSLFSDYAHKKRFVWMPSGTKASFNADNKVLDLPVGAVLIKIFYYENAQNVSPVGATRVIETRLMIHKSTGWIFADYVWNTEQTEAYLDLAGSFTDISWKDENNVTKSTNYRIPTEAQCIICHKSKQVVNGTETTTIIPIGIKPQNLNFNYNYGTTTKNQLTKWVEQGYLDGNFSLPTQENTTINYNDTSKSIDLRARSYVDINCAHCHQDNRFCEYRPMRFDFSSTGKPNGLGQTNMGVCVSTQDMETFPASQSSIVKPGNISRSMMYYRMNTTDETYRMPLHGRTVIHEEGVALITQWINSLQGCP